jgi:hypothetical protein
MKCRDQNSPPIALPTSRSQSPFHRTQKTCVSHCQRARRGNNCTLCILIAAPRIRKCGTTSAVFCRHNVSLFLCNSEDSPPARSSSRHTAALLGSAYSCRGKNSHRCAPIQQSALPALLTYYSRCASEKRERVRASEWRRPPHTNVITWPR